MNKDGAINRLLKRNLASMDIQPAGTCLDAETLAAWAEGALPEPARAAAEAHVADCARCLALLATHASTEPALVEGPWWTRPLRLRWLVPVTAAAAAVLLWVWVERPPAPAMVQPAAGGHVAKADTEAALPSGSPTRADSGAEPPRESPDASREAPEARLRSGASGASASGESGESLESRGQPAPARTAADSPASAAPAAPPPPAAEERYAMTLEGRKPAGTISERSAPAADDATAIRRQYEGLLSRDTADGKAEIISPDPAVRWRLVGSTIERSADGGLTWHRQPAGVSTLLLAGSAPAPTVCWVVGRAGVVLRSIDGATWTQLAFPEGADLVAVDATSASAATVTTAGGRAYQTADGGRTWALQEESEAPF